MTKTANQKKTAIKGAKAAAMTEASKDAPLPASHEARLLSVVAELSDLRTVSGLDYSFIFRLGADGKAELIVYDLAPEDSITLEVSLGKWEEAAMTAIETFTKGLRDFYERGQKMTACVQKAVRKSGLSEDEAEELCEHVWKLHCAYERKREARR